ncbi:MAG: NnrU family protein [Acetobacteraceae bacterium]|nr:NnrU family protein [Acetobacteraceae bacterium]
MMVLAAAVAVWLAVHLGLAGTRLRGCVVAVLGAIGFRAVFSVLALLSLYLLVHAWMVAKGPDLWFAPQWLRVLLVLAMLPTFLLFVSAFTRRQAGPPRGMVRVTRHPMLWSFVLWGVVHALGTGDLASVVFFGTFVVTALAGMPSIDAKQARRDPAAFAALSAATSILPFQAIRQGRNRFVPAEIGWMTIGIAVVAWGAVFWLHPLLFGVSPLL